MKSAQCSNVGIAALIIVVTSIVCCQGWTIPKQRRLRQHRTVNSNNLSLLPSRCHYHEKLLGRNRDTTSRLYNSNADNESSGNDGLFSKAGKALTSLFGGGKTQEEKKGLVRRKETKKKVSGSIKEILKDAPLGVRMVGEMISPLVSGIASTVAESLVEQQRTMEEMMREAQLYLQNDPDVTRIFGKGNIILGPPISQSSYTNSMNGQTQSRTELVVPVSSSDGFSYGSSTVNILAINNEITQMDLNTVGQRIQVNVKNKQQQQQVITPNTTTRSSRRTSSTTTNGRTRPTPSSSSSSSSYSPSSSTSSNGDDNIIEAEIIDKDTRQ